MRQRTPEKSRGMPQNGESQAPRLSSFTAWAISCLLVSTVTICCVVGRPYIIELMREVHLDGDEAVGKSTIWHRQRQFVSAEEEVEMLKLLLAQKEEGVEEDKDADFVTSFQRVIPEGYVKVDDYDDDENEYSAAAEKGNDRESWRRAGVAPSSRRSVREVEGAIPDLQPPRSTHRLVIDGASAGTRISAEASQSAGATESSKTETQAAQSFSDSDAINAVHQTNLTAVLTPPTSDGVTFVPMLEGAFDLQSVETKGRHFGYMSNEGPVKILENSKWKLRKDETWMQPPSVCPGKPSKKGLATGGPPKKHQTAIEKAIENMAEGKYQEEKDGVQYLVENRCLFLTRDCAQLNLTYGGPSAMKSLKSTPEEFEKLRADKLIDLKPRSLGSCALVANSENLLSGARGAEIDAHDTIFRHNTPVKGFEKAVGKRPSSVMWVKAKYMKKASAAGNAELMYDLLVGVDRLPKSFVHRGKSLMIVNKSGGGNKYVKERSRWYKMAGASGKNHPSGGFARPLALLASGLCTRVDLYGFSSKPSGKYFERSFKVLDTHMMGFEHWVYRYLQSKGKLCVYGE